MGTKKDLTKIDFEAAFSELNQIVEQIEHSELNLEDALKKSKLIKKETPVDAIAITYGPGLEMCLWEGIVFAKSFYPAPKTDSAILKIVSKKRFGKAKNDSGFTILVCELFRYKNKNLSKALSHAKKFLESRLDLKEPALEKFLQESQLLGKKVYLLEVQEFVEVFNALF